MMADTTDARRGDQRRAPPPVFDTAIPHVKKREEREVQEGRMNFTLLSKKGNRQQVRFSFVVKKETDGIDAFIGYPYGFEYSSQSTGLSTTKSGREAAAQAIGAPE
jgi:hypothetical protein